MNQQDVKTLADLARLSLTDDQCKTYQKDFESILTYIDSISAVDVAPSTSAHVHKNIVRNDDESYEPGIYQEDILAVAPDQQDHFIKVKNIL